MNDCYIMERGESSARLDRFSWRQWIVTIFLFALFMRLVMAGAYLNSYDTEWNLMWGIELGDGFFTAYAHLDALDYPPLYLYPLYPVGRLMNISEFAGYPPFRMLAIKFFPCLADSLTCVVFYRLGAKRVGYWGAMAAAVWALNPAAIFNCAFWGQTDCVLMCMAALLFVALGERRLVASGILFAAMCATKLQGLYLTPVVGMEVLTVCFGSLRYRNLRQKRIEREQVKDFLRFAAAVMGTLAVVYLPFMIGGAAVSHDKWAGFFLPLTVYSEGLDKYPYITMNADNFYMLLGWNGVNDSTRVLPGISAGLAGKFFLMASVLGVVAVYVFGRRKSHWLAAYLLMECIFMLTCRQHERYQILTLVMLMGAFLQLADKRIFTVFTLQAFVILVNQSRVLGVVRERSLWWGNYTVGNQAMNDTMRESMNTVVQRGVWWVNHSHEISLWNSLLNVCVFFASMTLVLRFYFDKKPKIPFPERVKEWAQSFETAENF